MNKEDIQVYEFNQEIIDAVREGKNVWIKRGAEEPWVEVNQFSTVYLVAIANYKWSLTKPKPKIKKTYERWVNIFKDGTAFNYLSKQGAEAASKWHEGDIEAVALYVVTSYEVEE